MGKEEEIFDDPAVVEGATLELPETENKVKFNFKPFNTMIDMEDPTFKLRQSGVHRRFAWRAHPPGLGFQPGPGATNNLHQPTHHPHHGQG